MLKHFKRAILATMTLAATFIGFSSMANAEKSNSPVKNDIVVMECIASENGTMTVSAFSSNLGLQPVTDCAQTLATTMKAFDNGYFTIDSTTPTHGGVIYTLKFIVEYP